MQHKQDWPKFRDKVPRNVGVFLLVASMPVVCELVDLVSIYVFLFNPFEPKECDVCVGHSPVSCTLLCSIPLIILIVVDSTHGLYLSVCVHASCVLSLSLHVPVEIICFSLLDMILLCPL